MKTIVYGGREIPWALRPLEKVVQANCVELLTLAGAVKVGSTSQYRASHTTEGIPDLWFFHPKLPGTAWYEVKRPGEGLSERQVEFGRLCIQAGAPWAWGTDEDLKRWLVKLHLVTVTPAFGFIPLSRQTSWLEPNMMPFFPFPALHPLPWCEPL